MTDLTRICGEMLPNQVETFIRDSTGIELEMMDLSPGAKPYDISSLSIAGMNFVLTDGGEAMRIRATAPADVEVFTFVANPKGTVRGYGQPSMDSQSYGFYFGDELIEHIYPTSEDYILSLGLSRSLCRQMGWELHHAGRILPVEPVLIEALRLALTRASCQYLFVPGGLSHADESPIQQEILGLITQLLSPWLSNDIRMDRQTRSEKNYDRIFRLATRRMQALDPQKPLSMDQLAKDVYTSRRSLFQAFNYWVGMGPNAYYQVYRLRKLRRRLLAADPSETTVTEQAQQLGFNHVGRMIGQYRQQFAETPKQSLNG